MSRKREPREPAYTPPLPASRDAADEVRRALALRLHSVSAQLHHLADLLDAYGWTGCGQQVRAHARGAGSEAATLGGWYGKRPPAACEAENAYWQGRTLNGLTINW